MTLLSKEDISKRLSILYQQKNAMEKEINEYIKDSIVIDNNGPHSMDDKPQKRGKMKKIFDDFLAKIGANIPFTLNDLSKYLEEKGYQEQKAGDFSCIIYRYKKIGKLHHSHRGVYSHTGNDFKPPGNDFKPQLVE